MQRIKRKHICKCKIRKQISVQDIMNVEDSRNIV